KAPRWNRTTARAATEVSSSGERTSPVARKRTARGGMSAAARARRAPAVERPRRRRRLAGPGQVRRDALAQVGLDDVDRPARVDAPEVELLRQHVVLVDEASLVALEGIEDVVAEREVHARLPVVHPLALEDARHEAVDVDLEVEDQVGREGEP